MKKFTLDTLLFLLFASLFYVVFLGLWGRFIPFSFKPNINYRIGGAGHTHSRLTEVKKFGKDWVEIVLLGDTFDDAFQEAMVYSTETGKAFIHPFNDIKIIEGQGTVALEILNQYPHHIDYLIAPIGGGGLIAGCGIVFSALSPKTMIIGVEPAGAPAMFESIKQDKIVTLNQIDSFVDGAAVKKVGEINFPIVKKTMSKVLLVDEGKVCHTLLQLYNDEGFVVEPAGTLSIAALDEIKEEIKGKTVVCI